MLVFLFFSDASYFVDAMSSFGAVPINLSDIHADFMVSSANKCLEGVPGFAYAIARKTALQKCKGMDPGTGPSVVVGQPISVSKGYQ